jgi:hypothetical protein
MLLNVDHSSVISTVPSCLMAGISLVTVLGYNLEIQINYEGRSAFLSLGYGSTKFSVFLEEVNHLSQAMHNAQVLPRHPLQMSV